LPIYFVLPATENAAIYGPKRTELNKNNATEMAIMETEKP